jgi:hypothetical protein
LPLRCLCDPPQTANELSNLFAGLVDAPLVVTITNVAAARCYPRLASIAIHQLRYHEFVRATAGVDTTPFAANNRLATVVTMMHLNRRTNSSLCSLGWWVLLRRLHSQTPLQSLVSHFSFQSPSTPNVPSCLARATAGWCAHPPRRTIGEHRFQPQSGVVALATGASPLVGPIPMSVRCAAATSRGSR